METRRFLLDVDTGIDDAVALLMALRAPGVAVAGVTVVHGNVPVDMGLDNTRRVLDLAEAPASVAVARGADRPLLEARRDARHVHGAAGLADYPLPESRRPVDPRPAAVFLAETLLAADEPVTLVATAPLTNLALALRLAPEIAGRIERLVIMGGSTDGTGNATAAAEFNFHVDPEAAWIVLHADLPVTLVGLDPCRPTRLAAERARDWRGHASPRLRFLAGILDWFARRGRPAIPLYDAVAMTAALRPDLAQTERLSVELELAAGPHRGALLVDRRPAEQHDPDWPQVEAVTFVDAEAHERLLVELLT